MALFMSHHRHIIRDRSLVNNKKVQKPLQWERESYGTTFSNLVRLSVIRVGGAERFFEQHAKGRIYSLRIRKIISIPFKNRQGEANVEFVGMQQFDIASNVMGQILFIPNVCHHLQSHTYLSRTLQFLIISYNVPISGVHCSQQQCKGNKQGKQ